MKIVEWLLVLKNNKPAISDLAVRSCVVLALLLLSACTISKNQDSATHPVDDVVIRTLEAINARGGSFAIKTEDSDLYAATYGLGHLIDEPTPLASLSKPVTAYIILRMEKEGLLNTGSPVRTYVPEIANLRNGRRIAEKTILDFLTHNSGLAFQSFPPLGSWEQRMEGVLDIESVSGNVEWSNNL